MNDTTPMLMNKIKTAPGPDSNNQWARAAGDWNANTQD
jgi:hypothetical protein